MFFDCSEIFTIVAAKLWSTLNMTKMASRATRSTSYIASYTVSIVMGYMVSIVMNYMVSK